MNEELRWMLASITHLLQAKDYYGAFVMCLNTMEPLAAKRYPKLKSGERFQKFLYEERQPYCKVKNIYLPDAGSCKTKSPEPTPDLDDFDGDTERWREALDAHLEEMQKDLIPIELVLWRYCRNPIVHEGARLAVDGDAVVTLDWTVPPTSLTLKVDQEAKNVIVISAQFLLYLLYQIVAKHLSESDPAT